MNHVRELAVPPGQGFTAEESGALARLRNHAWFALVVVLMAAIGVVCLKDSVAWIGKPFPGFLYYEFPVVGSFGDYEWAGMRAGIRYRDVIREINGQKISSGRDIERFARQTPAGETLSYLIARRGEQFRLQIPVAVFGLKDLLQIFGLPFLAGVVFWLIGVIVYFLKPNTSSTWAFLLVCFFLGTYFVTGFQLQSKPVPPWYYLNALSNSFFPAAAFHLSLLFPERTALAQRWPRLQLAPYVVAAFLTMYRWIDVFALTRGELDSDSIVRYSAHLLMTLQFNRLYAVLAAISIVLASAYAYRRSASVIAKQRARVVLLASGAAFVPATIAMGLAAISRLVIPFNLLSFPGMIFPAAIGYAIARHNLFDVDVYVKRAVGYGVMTAIVGAAYFAIQTLMSTFVLGSVFGDYAQQVSPFVFAVLVVFLFNPVSRRVQDSVDRLFFRKKLDYKETISAVSNALTSLLNLDQILKQVVNTIRNEMFVDTAGVIVLEPQKQACWTFFTGDQGSKDGSLDVPVGYDDPLLSLVRQEKALITKYDMDEDPRFIRVRDACTPTFSNLCASLVIPFLYQGEVTGVLAVGQKKSGHFYTREDVDLLSTMANQAAVAIQNATTHEEVVRYAEELAASLRRIQILESIKSNLSKFVPKTVQDLIEESPEAPLLDKREADVSVVFADITGYTRLSAQMELDQVNQLVERYFGAFLDEIVRFGGDVNETVGDGLMVIFRDPDPQHHARAAVLAALGIQRRTREINAELSGQFEPIAMHVGVNSGIASVGATKIEGAAGTRWTYTASGPTTNVAARLAALGEEGLVILSEETRRRLGDEFEAEDLGPQSLKNVAQPVRVFRLKAEDREPAAARAFVERRRHPRRVVSWPVRLWIGEESLEGRAVDASIHGICVTSVPMALLSVGKSYRLDIVTEGDGKSSCVAEIRNLSDRGVGMETREALPLG